MLGALAAVALLAGSVGATVSISQNDQQATDPTHEPVVEIQTVQTKNQTIQDLDAFTE